MRSMTKDFFRKRWTHVLQASAAIGLPASAFGLPASAFGPAKMFGSFAALTFLVMLGGCFFASRSSVDDLDRRVKKLEQGVAVDVAEARAKLAELESLLERATSVVTRNSADLGVEVDEMKRELQALQGNLAELRQELDQAASVGQRMEELEQRLRSLEGKVGIELTPDAAPEVPESIEAHWQAARSAYAGDKFAEARLLFRAFVQKYPEDENADDAQLGVGYSYLKQDKPATALGEFRRVVESYPKGDAADDALYGMAEGFWRLGACKDAKTALQTLIKTYRKSNSVAKARALLKKVQRAPAAQCTR